MGTIILTAIILFAVILLTTILLKENKMKSLVLAPIGIYKTAHNNYDLRQYFIDCSNNLYSGNLDSWELNSRKYHDLLRCSNKSADASGYIVNSMRDTSGKKATVPRINLDFEKLVKLNGSITIESEFITDRHIRIHKLKDLRIRDIVGCFLFSDAVRLRHG